MKPCIAVSIVIIFELAPQMRIACKQIANCSSFLVFPPSFFICYNYIIIKYNGLYYIIIKRIKEIKYNETY